jgi:pantoate--beta-alanine ligase
MIVSSDISEIRLCRWRDRSATWGLVPTMGALHQGHINLIRQARKENDHIAVSIFVNPIQFNNQEDLESYPSDLDNDLQILKKEDVDLVWTPGINDIYPDDYQTYIQVEQISSLLEGKSRPGHFKGVATVVAILFNTFQPNRAYFGQKDAQQLMLIKQMVQDLKFNLEIISCPTIRAKDGLAISSRNKNLSEQGRKQAVCLYKALSAADEAIATGEINAENIKSQMKHMIDAYPLAKIDYISIAHPNSLEEIETVENQALISLAVFIEDVRLIDNMIIDI